MASNGKFYTVRQSCYTVWTLASVLALALGILGLAGFILHLTNDPKNIKTINGVGPARGEVGAVGGTGITIIPDPATNTITWENAGINSVTAGDGISAVTDPDGNVVVSNTGIIQNVAGAGISESTSPGGISTIGNTGVLSVVAAGVGVSVNASTGDVSVSNTGVHSMAVGSGLEVDMATGAVTVEHTQSRRTLDLGASDVDGTHVVYNVDIGYISTVPPNEWRVTVVAGFFPILYPGAVDNGAGNALGFDWTVPNNGLYALSVDCEVFPSAFNVDDHQSISVVAVLGATDVDPYAAGYIPAGAQQTLDISSGTTAGPTVPSHLSLSSVFQVCADCAVTTGTKLTLHARQDVESGVGDLDASCRLQVTQLV